MTLSENKSVIPDFLDETDKFYSPKLACAYMATKAANDVIQEWADRYKFTKEEIQSIIYVMWGRD